MDTSVVFDNLACPITHEIFHTPVIASDGFTYEQEAIEKYYLENKSSPMTRKDLDGKFIVSVLCKQMVEHYLETHPEKRGEQYKPVVYNLPTVEEQYKPVVYSLQTVGYFAIIVLFILLHILAIVSIIVSINHVLISGFPKFFRPIGNPS